MIDDRNDPVGRDARPNEDETLRDVVASLRILPTVTEDDVQRIVARAAAESAEVTRRSSPRWGQPRPTARGAGGGSGPSSDVVPLRPPRPWYRQIPLAAAAALLVTAGVGGWVMRDAMRGAIPGAVVDSRSAPGQVAERSSPVAGTTPSGPQATAVAATAPVGEAPIATQFVLDAPRAATVSLVGGFNEWDAAATPLVRDAGSGLWSVSLPLAPGRHVYAFMVDGGVLTLDPRAPSSRDRELGTSVSVVLVGAR